MSIVDFVCNERLDESEENGNDDCGFDRLAQSLFRTHIVESALKLLTKSENGSKERTMMKMGTLYATRDEEAET